MYNYFDYQRRYTTPMIIKRIKKREYVKWILTKNMETFDELKLIDIRSMEKWMAFMDVR